MSLTQFQPKISKAAGLLRESLDLLDKGKNGDANARVTDAFSLIDDTTSDIMLIMRGMDVTDKRDAVEAVVEELTTISSTLEDDVPDLDDAELETDDLDEIKQVIENQAIELEQLILDV